MIGRHYSSAFSELTNIINAAKWHREHCAEKCDVALYQLGMTAKRLVNHCWLSEKRMAERMISEMNWT